EPENFVSYGPYAIKEWPRGESITLIKNPFWPGTDEIPQPAIDEIGLYVLDETTALARYEAGELHLTDAGPVARVPRILADPTLSQEYYSGPQACTYYYGFSVGVAPMDNVHLRRALSYAVDREDIINNILQGGQLPAPFLSNPTLNAAPLVED